MKDSINYIKVEDREKVAKAWALTMESGLTAALKDTQRTIFTSCLRIEKTSLQAILKSNTLGISGMEVRFDSGLDGNALLLIRTNDLFRLGEYISGAEATIDDVMPPELMEACLNFFGEALQASNKAFAEQYYVSSNNSQPELINPDGKTGSLLPLASSYDGVLCLTFQLIVEPHLDSNLHVLMQAPLFDSLAELLPDYDPNPPVKSMAEQRLASRKEVEEVPDMVIAPSEMNSLRHSDNDVRKTGNWNMDLLLDVELPIVVCFGESEMPLKDILRLGVGSVIELDRSVNDPVTVIVNRKPIAKGEVVMVDGNYGVRILEVDSTADRIRSLG
jgi:flagellar motor switch protein FliN